MNELKKIRRNTGITTGKLNSALNLNLACACPIFCRLAYFGSCCTIDFAFLAAWEGKLRRKGSKTAREIRALFTTSSWPAAGSRLHRAGSTKVYNMWRQSAPAFAAFTATWVRLTRRIPRCRWIIVCSAILYWNFRCSCWKIPPYLDRSVNDFANASLNR